MIYTEEQSERNKVRDPSENKHCVYTDVTCRLMCFPKKEGKKERWRRIAHGVFYRSI